MFIALITMPKPASDESDEYKTYQCPIKGCGAMFENESLLNKHVAKSHPSYGKVGGIKLQEGVVLEENEPEINEAGYVVNSQNKPIDEMNTLRRILTNNGIKDRRESIIEMFEYENIEDVDALDRILAMADVAQNKRKFVVSLWQKHIGQTTGVNVDEKGMKQVAGRKKGVMDITPEEMMNWGPAEYANYYMELQKFNQARNMQMTMFDKMFGGFSGGNEPDRKGKVDPEIQAKLDRLRALEEQERLNKMMEPFVKELRYLRAEQEEKKTERKSPLEDLKELAMMKQYMEGLGSKEGAEMMRMQMDERIEKMRIEAQRETDKLRLESERAKEESRRLEIKNVETSMGAKVDNLKAALDLASQTKKDDLLTTIKQAQEITTAMKSLTGDVKSPEDKKMETIAAVIDSAVQTLKPVAVELARNMGNKGQNGPPRYGPPNASMPPMGYEQMNQGQGQFVVTKCPAEGCGYEFNVDVTKSSAECPNCHSRYNVQPMAPPQIRGGGMPSMGGGRTSFEQKKSVLMSLPREELDAAAKQLGLTPELYSDAGSLVDDMLRHSDHV
jgi:hypothetical protein